MVKKEKYKYVKSEHHYYHPPHKMWTILILWFFGAMMFMIVLSNVLSWTTHQIQKEEDIYESCVYSCSKKNFIGTNIGMDMYSKAPVLEFDRTDCIRSCNNLYIKLTKG